MFPLIAAAAVVVVVVVGASTAAWIASEVYRGTRIGFGVYVGAKCLYAKFTNRESPLEQGSDVRADTNVVVGVSCFIEGDEMSNAVDRFHEVWASCYDSGRIASVAVGALCRQMYPDQPSFENVFLAVNYEVNEVEYLITYESEQPNDVVTFPVYPVASPIARRTDGKMQQQRHNRITSAKLMVQETNVLRDVTTTIVMLAGPRGNFYTDTPQVTVRGDWIRYELGDDADHRDAYLFLCDSKNKRYVYPLATLVDMKWPLDRKHYLIQGAPPPVGLYERM